MATPPLTETLTITETERHLQEALTLVKYDPDTRTTVTFPLDNLDQANSLTDLNRQLSNIIRAVCSTSVGAPSPPTGPSLWNTPSLWP